MDNGMIINCKKVYSSGKEYLDYKDEISSIQKELEETADNIHTIWTGSDSDSFTDSFKNHIKDLNLIISFLSRSGDLLKKTSHDHGSIDNNFAKEVERSDMDEFEPTN